jgi:hypothetical protein
VQVLVGEFRGDVVDELEGQLGACRSDAVD